VSLAPVREALQESTDGYLVVFGATPRGEGPA
jgi:hypothetical protein